MKKSWILAGAVVLILLTQKNTGTDISELEPVEAIQILTTEDGVSVRTDTGASGYGSSLSRAVENLHSSASAQIFLETADYVLVDREQYLEELYSLLRPACKVCLTREPVQLEVASRYLAVHDPEVTLLTYRAGAESLKIYYSKEGRGQLVG